MSDWQKGDLALCIEYRSTHPELKAGSVWSVTGVFVSHLGRTGLHLAGVKPRYGRNGFLASKFIKVTPEPETLEDRGIIEIMKKDHSHVD